MTMKKLICILSLPLFLMSCEMSVSPSEVPANALTEFNTRYASATDVSWSAEKENGHFYFEAHFKWNGEKKEAHFRTDGTFVEEEK
jgi:hypothetical protein